jgi:glycerol-3-phosphate acyltransferase PlsX
MRIGLDIMGGDYAPEQIVSGAILAYKELSLSHQIVLLGPKQTITNQIIAYGGNPEWFSIIDTPETIAMGEDPVKAFKTKPKSSIVQGFRMLKENQLDGFASAGSTGAMMVGAMHVSEPIPGVLRPCIASLYPNLSNRYNLIIDVGINANSKPEQLYQFGIIGTLYAQLINNVENPKVGLLNIGSEPGKGSFLCQKSFELMQNSNDFNFIGNIEATDLFNNYKVDVIVTDGFTGNVVIKQAESFYSIMKQQNISNTFLDRLNFENIGGTPVLGINHTVVIGHGISNDIAVKNMVLQTKLVIESNISANIKKMLNNE